MNNNYFIIHGSYGNPYKNWIPWLKKELGKRKLNCVVPSFPTPDKQDYESWSKVLMAYFEIGYITESTIFIAHSLGAIFVIKFLVENKIKVKKIITVAGFNNLEFNDDMRLYQSFYMSDENLNMIRSYCDEIVSFYSNNDPYVAVEAAKELAKSILSQEIVIKDAGHFNEKYGYTEFREILKFVV